MHVDRARDEICSVPASRCYFGMRIPPPAPLRISPRRRCMIARHAPHLSLTLGAPGEREVAQKLPARASNLEPASCGSELRLAPLPSNTDGLATETGYACVWLSPQGQRNVSTDSREEACLSRGRPSLQPAREWQDTPINALGPWSKPRRPGCIGGIKRRLQLRACKAGSIRMGTKKLQTNFFYLFFS